MADVVMRCPNCGETYGLTPEQAPQYAGQTINCTKCGRPFVAQVPGFPASPPPPPMAPPMASPHVPYAAPMPHQQQKSNGLAIGSLVTGLVGFCVPLVGIVAIVLGAMGMKRATRDPSVGGRGLAIAGLVLGILSTMFLLVQISILLPSLNRAREQANRVKCASNLRQIGLACQMWANDHKGAYPPDIQAVLDDGQLTNDVFVCPSTPHTHGPSGTKSLTFGTDLSYVYVGNGLNQQSPPNAIVAYEPPTNHNPGAGGAGAQAGGNVLFADGHVEYVTNLSAEIAELQAGHNPPRTRGQRK